MSLLLAINSVDSYAAEVVGNQCHFSYKLPKDLSFSEPHIARLVWLRPKPKVPVFVFCDFLSGSFVQGQLRPLLGGSGFVESPWVPVATNFIPSTGFVHLQTHDHTPFKFTNQQLKGKAAFSLLIEIAPATHGAKGPPHF
jgi:hypothetical protein